LPRRRMRTTPPASGHWPCRGSRRTEDVLKSDLADDAHYIGESYSGDSRFREAVAAYERVVRDYPQSDTCRRRTTRSGSYERLGQPDKGARR
jgi:hypothetical protein